MPELSVEDGLKLLRFLHQRAWRQFKNELSSVKQSLGIDGGSIIHADNHTHVIRGDGKSQILINKFILVPRPKKFDKIQYAAFRIVAKSPAERIDKLEVLISYPKGKTVGYRLEGADIENEDSSHSYPHIQLTRDLNLGDSVRTNVDEGISSSYPAFQMPSERFTDVILLALMGIFGVNKDMEHGVSGLFQDVDFSDGQLLRKARDRVEQIKNHRLSN